MLSIAKEQMEIINQQIKEIVGIYKDAVAQSGISENEFWILYTLIIMEGEYSQQDICSMWSLSKQTVNTIISHMLDKEYLELQNISGNRNRKVIKLTDKGKIYGEAVLSPVVQAEIRAMDRITIEERNACIKILSKYIIFLKEELYEI